MPKRACLRVHGHGEVEVDLTARYLADLTHAYNSILVFESTIDGMHRIHRDYPLPLAPSLVYDWAGPFFRRRGVVRAGPPSRRAVAFLIPQAQQLVLARVRLGSPGSWDFLGVGTALEVLRQYLNDRQKRRQDSEYRESAEQRRLELENLQLENAVLRERIEIAKNLGATPADLAPLLNGLIHGPLSDLGRSQDKHIIEGAEIKSVLPSPDE